MFVVVSAYAGSATNLAVAGTAVDAPSILSPAATATDCASHVSVKLGIGQGHRWRPPFGIDRVGSLPVVHAEFSGGELPRGTYVLTAYGESGTLERHTLYVQQAPLAVSTPDAAASFFANVSLRSIPTAIVLERQCTSGGPIEELLRQPVEWPVFEADARARTDRPINPIDLGTILVPYDWLLLTPGQSVIVEVAALARTELRRDVRVLAWFDGGKRVETAAALEPNRRVVREVRVPFTLRGETTTLHVSILAGDRELWHKKIRTMVVTQPAHLPAFGAVETKLRYDAPIAVGHVKDGKSQPPLDYKTAWNPKFNDVVVALPNGSRFVFWRGANYIPVWAGLYNTAFSYEWAEAHHLNAVNAEGDRESPEPLNDKELRYSTVRIVESTASRVHVRWGYQSTDVHYKTWGEQAVEDFYFYPDGFGTRVMTLTAPPEARYETSEFIILLPQAAFPFELLPKRVVQVLNLAGQRLDIEFPITQSNPEGPQRFAQVPGLMGTGAIYRVYLERRDNIPVIYFNPTNPPPAAAFGALYAQGELATPAYWGDHWPLSREKLTRYYVHDGVYTGPAHSSVLSWLGNVPTTLSSVDSITLDALGQVRTLRERRWAWLIGKSDASDDELLAWAHSFSRPPSLQVKGARVGAPSYSPERRAIRLIIQSNMVDIEIKPQVYTMNPVFELDGAARSLDRVTVDGKALPSDHYAWDGTTLWVSARIDSHGSRIGLEFRR